MRGAPSGLSRRFPSGRAGTAESGSGRRADFAIEAENGYFLSLPPAKIAPGRGLTACLSTSSNATKICKPDRLLITSSIKIRLRSKPQTRGASHGNERWASTLSLLRACKLLISKWVVCPPSHKSLSILLHFFFSFPTPHPSISPLSLSVGCVKMSGKPPSSLPCADYEPVFVRGPDSNGLVITVCL